MKNKIASGLFWKLLELAGAQGVQFVVALVLARLMSPEEYGTIGLIMIFITIANVFVQSGFATALIQRPDIREEDYSSVFRISLLLAVPVWLLLYIGAPSVAAYYDVPVLKPLLRVMGLVLFPGAVISVQTAYVSREMNFRQLFKATMSAVILSGAAAIFLASRGFGVWAMAAQQLVYYAALMTGLFITVEWRPSAGFDAGRLKELFRFGWKILVSGLIDTIWMNIYGLIIGKRYSQADLGGYSRGEQFPKLITSNLSAAIQAVLLPAYAKNQSDPVRLKGMMKQSIRFSAFSVFPMMAGLAGCSVPLVRVLLTDKWLFSVPYLCIMCLCYAFWPIHVTNLQMVTALGRSDLFLKLEILKKALGIVILLISLPHGIIFMLLLKAADEFLCTFINAWPVRNLIGYGIAEQYLDMLPSAVCAAAMGGVVWEMQKLEAGGLGPAAILLLQIAAGMLLYAGLSLLLNRRTMLELLEVFRRRKNGEAPADSR